MTPLIAGWLGVTSTGITITPTDGTIYNTTDTTIFVGVTVLSEDGRVLVWELRNTSHVIQTGRQGIFSIELMLGYYTLVVLDGSDGNTYVVSFTISGPPDLDYDYGWNNGSELWTDFNNSDSLYVEIDAGSAEGYQTTFGMWWETSSVTGIEQYSRVEWYNTTGAEWVDTGELLATQLPFNVTGFTEFQWWLVDGLNSNMTMILLGYVLLLAHGITDIYDAYVPFWVRCHFDIRGEFADLHLLLNFTVWMNITS
jgi:hypothetical protein